MKFLNIFSIFAILSLAIFSSCGSSVSTTKDVIYFPKKDSQKAYCVRATIGSESTERYGNFKFSTRLNIYDCELDQDKLDKYIVTYKSLESSNRIYNFSSTLELNSKVTKESYGNSAGPFKTFKTIDDYNGKRIGTKSLSEIRKASKYFNASCTTYGTKRTSNDCAVNALSKILEAAYKSSSKLLTQYNSKISAVITKAKTKTELKNAYNAANKAGSQIRKDIKNLELELESLLKEMRTFTSELIKRRNFLEINVGLSEEKKESLESEISDLEQQKSELYDEYRSKKILKESKQKSLSFIGDAYNQYSDYKAQTLTDFLFKCPQDECPGLTQLASMFNDEAKNGQTPILKSDMTYLDPEHLVYDTLRKSKTTPAPKAGTIEYRIHTLLKMIVATKKPKKK